MRLLSLEYGDHSRNWRLNPMNFSPLTLLVGASGVGKTRILLAILGLRSISRGNSRNGLQWRVRFSTPDNSEYVWEGEFEKRDVSPPPVRLFPPLENDSDDERDAPHIVSERLLLDGVEVIDRDRETIRLDGKPTPRLQKQQSVVYLLKEEDKIAPAYQGFQRIIRSDDSESGGGIKIEDLFDPTYDKVRTIQDIRESRADTRRKLHLAAQHAPRVFASIRERFTDVFPFVEDLKVEPPESNALPVILRDIPVIQIKEKGLEQWIDERFLSSGMYRTLMLISQAYLCADGTVVLVDEFENSLGVNCIDDLTEEILSHERMIQFIITSHHPYIINKVSPKNWKIITRRAGVVTARDAPDFDFSKSKHEAFLQLINRPEYAEGIDV